MATFGDSTPVPWDTGLVWDGNDDHLLEDEGDGWQEVGLATDVAEHFYGHISQPAPEPFIIGEGPECKISVAELLLVAAHTDQPELNFPDRRKRLAGKQCLKDDVFFCWVDFNDIQAQMVGFQLMRSSANWDFMLINGSMLLQLANPSVKCIMRL